MRCRSQEGVPDEKKMSGDTGETYVLNLQESCDRALTHRTQKNPASESREREVAPTRLVCGGKERC